MEHRFFSREELAEYLHIRPDDVDDLVRRQEIPFDRMGSRVVFRRPAVEAWASRRILGYAPAPLHRYHHSSTTRMEGLSGRRAVVSVLLPPERIAAAAACRTKPSLIRAMVRMAEATGLLVFAEDLRRSLEERERQRTTALAGGVALLHPGHIEPYVIEDSFLLLARTVHPIPFGSPDGRTTDLFFLICALEEHMHLHLLARLCMICHRTDALLRLRTAEDAMAMHEVLVECEKEVLSLEPG